MTKNESEASSNCKNRSSWSKRSTWIRNSCETRFYWLQNFKKATIVCRNLKKTLRNNWETKLTAWSQNTPQAPSQHHIRLDQVAE